MQGPAAPGHGRPWRGRQPPQATDQFATGCAFNVNQVGLPSAHSREDRAAFSAARSDKHELKCASSNALTAAMSKIWLRLTAMLIRSGCTQ